MPTMKQTALSDCSYPESTTCNIRDKIDATITRLKVVMDEEASLRKALRTLFVKRREEAIGQVRLAKLHLDLVNEEEAAFCEDLKQAAAIANEELKESGYSGSVVAWETAKPTLVPMPTGTPKDDAFLSGLVTCNQEPLQSPHKSICGLTGDGHGDATHGCFDQPPYQHDDTVAPGDGDVGQNQGLDGDYGFVNRQDQQRTPARVPSPIPEPPEYPPPVVVAPKKKKKGKKLKESAAADFAFEPPRSPARSARAFADEPTRSPARSTGEIFGEPAKSPTRSIRELFGEPPKSPARSTYAFEPPRYPARSVRGMDPTRSPARSARGLDAGPMPISPARSNRGLSNDAPPRSPARSTRGLDDFYLSPEATTGHSQRTPGKTQIFLPAFSTGDIYRPGIEGPMKSPARPAAALPTTFSFGHGGFGSSPTPNANAGFGFGLSPTVNTSFGFGVSPITNTGPIFGAPSQSPSAVIGFGAASLPNTGFGFGGTSQTSPTINFGLRPHRPTFDLNISSFGTTTQPMETPAVAEDLAGSNELFDDIMQEATAEDWGFDVPNDEDDTARGQSLKALVDDYLGDQLDSGYQHDDVVAIGDGGVGQNEGLDGGYDIFNQPDQQQTPARVPSPIPEPPEDPHAVVAAPKKKKKKKAKEPAADAEERAAMEEKRLAEEDKLLEELRQLAAEEAEWAERERLEEARLIAEAAENDRLALERRQDEIERQRLDDLRAKQEELAAAEAAMEAKELADEQVRLALANEEARKAAEVSVEADCLAQEDRQRIEEEKERESLKRQRRDERRLMYEAMAEERRQMMLAEEREEEERDFRVYRTFQEETAKAQERLAVVEGELSAVEARRTEMLLQLERARLKEVACRYQTRLRTQQIAQNR